MSQVHTVKTVLKLEVGERVQAFKARVKKIYDMRSGRGKRGGEWTKQGVIVADGSYELELAFWNRDKLPDSYEGKVIYIEADGGCEVGEYKGKRQMSVPEDANVTLAQESTQGATQQRQTTTAAKPAQSGNLGDARAFIGRARNLMILCVRAAASANKELGDMPVNESQISALLFQAGERAGMIDAMPTGPMTQAAKPAPKPEPDNQDDAPAEVPGGDEVPEDVPF